MTTVSWPPQGECGIRAARHEDAAPLAELFLATRRQTFTWQTGQEWSLDDFAQQTAGEDVYLAESEHRLAGFVSVWSADRFIHHLYVAAECQRQGVGSSLLDFVRQRYGLPLRLKCAVANTVALRFYQQRGWQTVEQAVAADGPYYLLQLPDPAAGAACHRAQAELPAQSDPLSDLP